MTKKYFLGTLIIMFALTILFSGCTLIPVQEEVNQDSSAEATTDQTVEAIKMLFAQKYDQAVEKIEVTINQQTDNHIRGMVKMGAEPGDSGMFLAAKVAEEWKLVYDGNGSILCSLVEEYDFSEEMVIDCYDDNLIGGFKDKHGCLGAAGYTWCEAKEKCLRTWEEPCE